jgi:hypothetical protein
MNKVTPMRRPKSSPLKYESNAGFIREFEFPIGVTLSVLSWMVLAVYFGAIVLAVFAVVSITGIGIGSFKHSRPESLVLSCVSTNELPLVEEQDQFRKAA